MDNNRDPELDQAVKAFESQFQDVDTEDKIAKARSLMEAELVGVTRRMLDLALYSSNDSIALRAGVFIIDHVMGPKGKSQTPDDIKEMYKKLGLSQ